MPHVNANEHRVYYELAGAANATVLLMSNSLGTTLEMWDEQIAGLGQHRRILRYDTRGLGRSEVTSGEYTLDQLGTDVLALTSALGIDRFSLCGLSMGGLIGLWLALNAGRRLQRVVLCNTAAKIGGAVGWNARISTARQERLADIAKAAIARWFTPEFAKAAPARVHAIQRQLLACSPTGYASNCAAIRDGDFRDRLGDIHIPVLVVAGRRDFVTTLADAQAVVSGISGARLAVMDAHTCQISAIAVTSMKRCCDF